MTDVTVQLIYPQFQGIAPKLYVLANVENYLPKVEKMV